MPTLATRYMQGRLVKMGGMQEEADSSLRAAPWPIIVSYVMAMQLLMVVIW